MTYYMKHYSPLECLPICLKSHVVYLQVFACFVRVYKAVLMICTNKTQSDFMPKSTEYRRNKAI